MAESYEFASISLWRCVPNTCCLKNDQSHSGSHISVNPAYLHDEYNFTYLALALCSLFVNLNTWIEHSVSCYLVSLASQGHVVWTLWTKYPSTWVPYCHQYHVMDPWVMVYPFFCIASWCLTVVQKLGSSLSVWLLYRCLMRTLMSQNLMIDSKIISWVQAEV